MVTDFRYGMIVPGQPLPGLLDPLLSQILMRRPSIDPGEQPMEMIACARSGIKIDINKFNYCESDHCENLLAQF
jgi:hypothetical protein